MILVGGGCTVAYSPGGVSMCWTIIGGAFLGDLTMGGPILAKFDKSNTTLGGCGLGGFLNSGCLGLDGGDFIGGSKPGGNSGHGLAGGGSGGNSGPFLIGGKPGGGDVNTRSFGFHVSSVAPSFGFPTSAKVLCNPDPELPVAETVGGPAGFGKALLAIAIWILQTLAMRTCSESFSRPQTQSAW